MSIASEISRISQNVSDSLDAVAAKGVSVPSGATSDDLANLIGNISTGSNYAIDTITYTCDEIVTSIVIPNLLGEPVAFFFRIANNITSTGSTTYYYITNINYNGSVVSGNYLRVGNTRGVYNDTTHYSYQYHPYDGSWYSSNQLALSSSGSRTSAGGCFAAYTYELVYIYET